MDSFGEFLTKNPIVIDNVSDVIGIDEQFPEDACVCSFLAWQGSGVMRGGLAGEEKARVQFDAL